MRLRDGLFLAVVIAGAAATGSPASAQQPQAAAAAPDAAPTPERLALARQVVAAAGGGDNMQKSLEAALRAIFDQTKLQMQPTDRAAESKGLDLIQALLAKYMPQMIDASAKAYAQTFTDAQLRDILAFYATPTGQALVQKLPQVMRDSMIAMQPTLAAMRADAIAATHAEPPSSEPPPPAPK